LIIHWICREDFGIERNQSPEKLSTVTHNSVFAAHRLKNAVPRLRDGIFLFLEIEIRNAGIQESRKNRAVAFASSASPLGKGLR